MTNQARAIGVAMKYSKIISTGKYAPEKVLTNADLEKMVDTSDDWIYSRTGIRERRIAVEDNYQMASKAALNALEGSDITAEDLDMIIVATMSSEYPFPSVGCLVQNEIGATNAFCYDLSAACTGFIFALDTADQYIRTGKAKNVMVIGSEKLSQLVDWDDRNTCVLFGDGAGAALLTASDEPGIIHTINHSIGSQYDCLVAEYVHKKTPFYEQKKNNFIQMSGREVFEFACTKVPECINEVLDATDTDADDIEHYILHQANMRILKKIAKKLKQDMSKFYSNMEFYGNTSAASVAIALDDMYKSGDLTGKKVVLAGFGGGLTYGSTVVQF